MTEKNCNPVQEGSKIPCPRTWFEAHGRTMKEITAIEFSNCWRMNKNYFDGCKVGLMTENSNWVEGTIEFITPIGNHGGVVVTDLIIYFNDGHSVRTGDMCLLTIIPYAKMVLN